MASIVCHQSLYTLASKLQTHKHHSMKTQPTLSLALFTLVSATDFRPQQGTPAKSSKKDAVPLSLAGAVFKETLSSCLTSEKSCESGCIPLTGMCCYTGSGGWCALGTYCDQGGCCADNELCGGEPNGCFDDQESCGLDYCMPGGSVCCGFDGKYCNAGETCTSDGFCQNGSGSNDPDSDGCSAGKESCGSDYCMPFGSVCCGDGSYCDSGKECTATGCIPAGDVSCGDGEYCKAGEQCTATGCIPEGAVSCGNGKFCDEGMVCSTNGDGICRLPGSDDDDDEDEDNPPTQTEQASRTAAATGKGGSEETSPIEATMTTEPTSTRSLIEDDSIATASTQSTTEVPASGASKIASGGIIALLCAALPFIL